jgi:periplasmic protein TonB
VAAAPAGPPAAAPAPGWNALLAAWLAAHRRYPEDARKRNEEGDVTVRFTVAGDGRVSDVAVVKGSGYGALDNSALGMLRGATLPAPGVEATRTVRIRFRLSD